MITNPDQIVKKGEELYQANKLDLEKNYLGKFVAINVETGELFISDTPETASKKAKDTHPGSVTFLTKIGPDRGVYTLRSFRGNSDNWNFSQGIASR